MRWIRAVAVWLWEMWHIWIGLLVLVVAIAFSGMRAWDQDAIRISGLILQLLGIGTVIWGIHETRGFFGQPSAADVFLAWLGRFPRFRPQAIGSGVDFGVGLDFGAEGYAGVGPIPDAIEERVARLEQGLELVNKRVSDTNRSLREQRKAHELAIKQESLVRESEDEAIRNSLEGAATGGLRISGMGAAWLLVGVTMSTIPAELSQWLL